MPEPSPLVTAEARLADLERQLAEIKSLNLLIGGLVHDFNNVLTAIAGHASLLEEEAVPGSEFQESAAAIRKAADHAAALAENLRGLSRLAPSRRQPVDLHATIQEVTALLKPSANGRIFIEQQLRAPAAVTLADPEEMFQLVLNLALNATQAMPAGGVLTFETEILDGEDRAAGVDGSETPWVVLTVRDTGRGIPAAIRDRIFEPFFTTRKNGGGTGLGLSVVARIVNSLHGHIAVESKEGAGSAFRVSVRSCRQDRQEAASAAPLSSLCAAT